MVNYLNYGYNIDYERIEHTKSFFVFVNHKTALFCWNKIKQEAGLCDVITFDSHVDFSGGFITQGDLETLAHQSDDKKWLRNNYVRPDLSHFSSSKEFVDWDLLDEYQNREIVTEQHKFLKQISDNFIDVAFMKNVVNDVYLYYLALDSSGFANNSVSCDDIKGHDHNFYASEVQEFGNPNKKFILDIDLDFFVERVDSEVIIGKDLDKHMELLNGLYLDNDCVGLTIALEPHYCGNREGTRKKNCLTLIDKLSTHFGMDFKSTAISLLDAVPSD